MFMLKSRGFHASVGGFALAVVARCVAQQQTTLQHCTYDATLWAPNMITSPGSLCDSFLLCTSGGSCGQGDGMEKCRNVPATSVCSVYSGGSPVYVYTPTFHLECQGGTFETTVAGGTITIPVGELCP